jgi:hypothetical protein
MTNYMEMQDGTWTTITGGCTVVRDLKDMLLDSYFSFMDDLRLHEPPGGKPFEIRYAFFFFSYFSSCKKVERFCVLAFPSYTIC